MVGAGEYILYAAGDPANFAKDWTVAPPGVMEKNFSEVVKYLAGLGWPFRQHATFDSTASRILNVLEDVNREVPLKKLRWGLDHCETLTPKTLERVAALGGHVNIQNRMSLDGEAFVAKYGAQAAADAPPIARIREMGIPLACGTDAQPRHQLQPVDRRALAAHRQDARRRRSCRARRTCSTAPRRCGCTPRAAPGSPRRKTRRARSRPASSPTWCC